MTDYCYRCEQEIEQIDLGDGSFGCPICKCDDSIEIFEDELQELIKEKLENINSQN